MLNQRLAFSITATFAIVHLGSSYAVAAEIVEDPALTTVKNSVIAMGYEPEVSGSRTIVLKDSRFVININVSSDKTMVYLYEQYAVNTEQSSKLPAVKLLTFNDSHSVYFSVGTDAAGNVNSITINQSVPIKSVNAAVMRTMIDNVKQTDTEQQALFNPANWK